MSLRNVGFDMSKNEVFNKNKPGPSKPNPDAVPTKGILKKEGDPKKNLPDRQIDSSKEQKEDMHQVYDKFLNSLKSERGMSSS